MPASLALQHGQGGIALGGAGGLVYQGIDDQAVASEFKVKVDQLLDLYSAWRESGDPALIAAMRQMVAAIRQIDPGFQFELPS